MEKYTYQDAFDKVAAHLLSQKTQSLNASGQRCAYRSPEGHKCAIGALIDDEHYAVEIENLRCNQDPVIKALKESGYPVSDKTFYLHLQYIHDAELPSFWANNLETFAKSNDLIYNG